MGIFEKKKIGINIFDDELQIYGYTFKQADFIELEKIFNEIRGINISNYKLKINAVKKLSNKIAYLTGISKCKTLYIFFPEEIVLNSEYKIFEDALLNALIADSLLCGWKNMFITNEVMIVLIGSNMPYNKNCGDNIYMKSIFVFAKKDKVVLGIVMAGGLFDTMVLETNLQDVNQNEFDEIISKMNNSRYNIPKSISDESRKEAKEMLSKSWVTDMNKEIYILAPKDEAYFFAKNIQGYEFNVPDGYESFILNGITVMMQYI